MAYAIYKELPLRGDEIRLLRFITNRFNNNRLRCELSVTSLSKAPEYVCLSYTWGSQDLDCPVLCSGTQAPVPVSPSCFAALKALRAATSQPIWVDQLSIDQTNTNEKNEQVQLMGQIFKTAASVFVWLDLPASPRPSSDLNVAKRGRWLRRCIPSLKTLPDRAKNPQNRPQLSYPQLGINFQGVLHRAETLALCLGCVTRQDQDISLQQADVLSDSDLWADLYLVLSQPYFRRKWVIQEVSMNRNVIVLSDGYACDLLTFAECVAAMKKPLGRRCIQSVLPRSHDLSDQPLRVWTPAHFRFNLGIISKIRSAVDASKKIPLLWLLQSCRNTEALLPHDSLYAIRSMAADEKSLPVPRYDLPVRQVFLDHAQYFIQQGYGLLMLEDAGVYPHRSAVAPPPEPIEFGLPSWSSDPISFGRTPWPRDPIIFGLPSWIPTWFGSESFHDPLKRRFYEESDIIPLMDVPHPTSQPLGISDDLMILTLTAVVFDRLEEVVEGVLPTGTLAEVWVEDDEHRKKLLRKNEVHPSLSRLRILVERHIQSATTTFDLRATLDLILAVAYVRNCDPEFDNSEELRTKLARTMRTLNNDPKGSVSQRLVGYELGRTESGNVGVVPELSRAGDRIMIYDGMWNSMVVRPYGEKSDGYYTIVGDSFFLPFEELRGLSSPDLPPRQIKLA